jgi:hypothetical protein
MFISITLLISTLFFQIILIQFITNQTLVKYKKLEIKNNMKVESLKVLKEIYKIENSMTILYNDNINSTIAILEKKCMSEYSKMNKCLIMDMQGRTITNNGTQKYCDAFIGFMDKIHPNEKILKKDIKSLLMSYGGTTTLTDGTVVSSSMNISPATVKLYGGYVNYLNDTTLYTTNDIANSLDNTTYTVDNFITKTQIAKHTRLRQMLPAVKTNDYKNITFYSLFSVEYDSKAKPVFFQELQFPMYSDYAATNNLNNNNKTEFIYGVESYLHMTIPKLKNIYKILENLEHGQYKKLYREILAGKFKPNEYTENENIYATAYIRFLNTIEILGYKNDPDKLFDAYSKGAGQLAKRILANIKSGTINFSIIRYELNYYNFNDANYKVDYYITDASTNPVTTVDINLCDFEKYINPTKFYYK